MQSIESIEAYAYGTSKDLVSGKGKIEYNIIIKQHQKWLTVMMLQNNTNWSWILDHPCRILITGGFWSGETISLLNLINQQPDIDKIYLYAKYSYEAKHQFLINKRESTGLKHFNDMDDIYKNIEEYNQNKKRKILIVFDDMTTDMLSNNKLNIVVAELFIRGTN